MFRATPPTVLEHELIEATTLIYHSQDSTAGTLSICIDAGVGPEAIRDRAITRYSTKSITAATQET